MFFILLINFTINATPLLVDKTPLVFADSPTDVQKLWQDAIEQIPASLQIQKRVEKLSSGLSIDALWIETNPTAPVFIISSGIHGPETYLGTALQRLFLKKLLTKPLPAVNFLFIHAMNPSGLQTNRRTNTNNVDLNRNFAPETEALKNNVPYQQMQDLIEPPTPVDSSWLARWSFYFKIVKIYLFSGKKTILGLLAGQNHSPQGLYFSGHELQEETRIVQTWIREFSRNTKTILHIDLHTGFGKRGHLHFYGSDEFTSPQQKTLLKTIFPNTAIDTGNDTDFYITHGDFIDWTWKTFPQKNVIPMVFEFGTMDSQTLLGGLRSLWISVTENQGFYRGFKSHDDQLEIEKEFTTLFNSQDDLWRQQTLSQGLEALVNALENLIKTNTGASSL